MNTYNKVVFVLLAAIALCGTASAETLYVNETGWWADPIWQSDSDVISGLGDVGGSSAPTVFQKDGTWYLIAGNSDGTFNGYNWTGSAWQQDSAINSSLGDAGGSSAPTVFQKDGTWYLISGVNTGVFIGYNWTGSAWQQDSIINNSLGDIGAYSKPVVFQNGSIWYLITGEYYGTFIGYNWTGSAWQQDSIINSSLGDVGGHSAPTVFQKGSTWYLISGVNTGVFIGYNWTGSAWQQDRIINNSLGDIGMYSTPIVFQKDSTWYLITGEQWGQFEGFNLLSFNETATPIQHAIDNATSGDTVYVWNGSYNENVDISTAHLTLEGEGRDVVTITAASSVDHVFEVTADYVNITKVNVTGATWASAAGVYIYTSSNCNVSNIKALNNYWGIAVYYHCYNNTVINNNVSDNGHGVYITLSDDNIITNNIINSNYANGIYVRGTNNTLTNNTANSNTEYGSFLWHSADNKLTNNTFNYNRIGIYSESSNNNIFTNNTADSNTFYGAYLSSSANNLLNTHNSTNNSVYDYFAWSTSINNTLLNCNLSSATHMMNDSTSQWIIKYTDGRIIDTDDPALSMICSDDNCTLTLEPNTDDYTLNMTTLNVTVSADTGSVSVSANSTLVSIDYINSTINDLNITALDRQLILESAGVQTMVFDPTNVFNLWNFEYYINATANRKAVSFNTYTTNATNLINFTFRNLYPSSNFDCKYDSVSFTTNTSGTTGTLEFNKSSWTANVTRTVEIYAVTTPYRCAGGLCWTYEGDAMVIYLDLNDSTVQSVQAQVTSPAGVTTNTSMMDFVDSGVITWRMNYESTNVKGTYTVDNFYRDRGSGWEPLDSFLSFESRAASGGGSGVSEAEAEEAEVPDGAGAGTEAEPEPEEHGIMPDKQFSAELTGGRATFTGSIISRVVTEQSGSVQIDEFKINPTTTSLIGGTRYGFADIQVPDRNIGGTICFYEPTTDTAVSIYHLEDNEWVEMNTRNVNGELCADAGHFSYFSLADEEMESVIESMTQLSLTPPKVSGILLYGWTDAYTTTHISNRELMNVSASEGVVCEILTTGDYANRTLRCTYTPEADEWSSLKYTGEIIAIDTSGYTRRIPVSVNVYNINQLSFPIITGLILLGGILLYRRYD